MSAGNCGSLWCSETDEMEIELAIPRPLVYGYVIASGTVDGMGYTQAGKRPTERCLRNGVCMSVRVVLALRHGIV